MTDGGFFLSGTSLGLASYLTVFGGVTFGSVLPVLPTGAIVSAAAAVAGHDNVAVFALVVVVATLAALIGDVITFGVCRLVGEPALRYLRGGRAARESGRIAAAQRRLTEDPYPVLVAMRLVPAGRIPVLLAAGLTSIRWTAFVAAQALACLAWALTYAVLGWAGGAAFGEPWEAVTAAVVLVLVVTVLVQLVLRLRTSRRSESA